MKPSIKAKIAKLIDVKSILTLLFAGLLAYIVITGAEVPELFKYAMTSVITYYFTRKNTAEGGSE